MYNEDASGAYVRASKIETATKTAGEGRRTCDFFS